jgi:RNA polymerase sigma factor (TIGR02999 family)
MKMHFGSRAILFGAAARAMRQVLVDAARRRGRLKCGGDHLRVTLNEDGISADDFAVEILELNNALEQLEKHSPRQAQVVECRFFGGMSTEETAQSLDLSRRTVVRDWTMTRVWLYREMRRPEWPNDG